jgi:hypothetical protein
VASWAVYAAFLDGAVSAKGVRYDILATRRPQLDMVLSGIAHAAPPTDHDEQIAFYTDAYDALTLAVVLDAGPPKSIMDVDGGKVWDLRTFTVAGEKTTLNAIEAKVRALGDPRVHAVLNCASKGCPPLPAKPIVADGLDAQLDAAAHGWVATNAYHLEGSTVHLSRIFDWYGADFAKEGETHAQAALRWLAGYTDAETAAKLTSGTLTTDWQDYDWSLNAAPH